MYSGVQTSTLLDRIREKSLYPSPSPAVFCYAQLIGRSVLNCSTAHRLHPSVTYAHELRNSDTVTLLRVIVTQPLVHQTPSRFTLNTDLVLEVRHRPACAGRRCRVRSQFDWLDLGRKWLCDHLCIIVLYDPSQLQNLKRSVPPEPVSVPPNFLLLPISHPHMSVLHARFLTYRVLHQNPCKLR